MFDICCSNILSTHSGSSHTEQELYEFIVSLDNSVERHNRTILHGKELDIYSEKHKLVKTGADSNLSEHEIMLQHHMYRIYDSGNLKYQYIQNNE